MIRLLTLVVKLALAALIANAALKVGTAYATFYRFKDAVAVFRVAVKRDPDNYHHRRDLGPRSVRF